MYVQKFILRAWIWITSTTTYGMMYEHTIDYTKHEWSVQYTVHYIVLYIQYTVDRTQSYFCYSKTKKYTCNVHTVICTLVHCAYENEHDHAEQSYIGMYTCTVCTYTAKYYHKTVLLGRKSEFPDDDRMRPESEWRRAAKKTRSTLSCCRSESSLVLYWFCSHRWHRARTR